MKNIENGVVDPANHYAFEFGAFREEDYLTPEQIDNVHKMEAATTDDMVRHILLNEH